MPLRDDMTEAEYAAYIGRVLRRLDVQDFMQVMNLTGSLYSPKVWFVSLTGEFGAEVKATREGNTRPRTIHVFGDTQAEALEKLASAVAAYLYPVKRHT